jgi:hypothetical protein
MPSVLQRIGLWSGPNTPPGLPDVDRFIRREPSEDHEAVLAYLQNGTAVMWYMGFSTCRVCGERNGNAELTDGRLLWPEGLAHYVEVHHIELPTEVRAAMRSGPPPSVDADQVDRDIDEGRLSIDSSW